MTPGPARGIRDLPFHHAGKPSVGFEIFRLSELYRRAARGLLPSTLAVPQRPEFHTLYVGLSGLGRHFVDFDPCRFGAGHLTVVPRGHIQAFTARRQVEAWMLLFSPEFLAADALVFGPTWQQPSIALPRAAEKDVLALCAQLAAEQRRPLDAQQPALLGALLAAVVAHADRQAARSDRAAGRPSLPAPLQRFFTIVERDHLRTRSVAYFARGAGVSPRRLGELLAAQGRPSAKQVISARVVLEQKRLLAHSDVSVKELAARTGFPEPTNLVKFFRHRTGMTPIEFRASLQPGRVGDRRFSPSRRRS